MSDENRNPPVDDQEILRRSLSTYGYSFPANLPQPVESEVPSSPEPPPSQEQPKE
jgi:hypothetical protein